MTRGRSLTLVIALSVLAITGCSTKNTTSPTPSAALSSTVPAGTPSTAVPAATPTSAPQTWPTHPVTVTHNVAVPPVPVLTGIRSAAHTSDHFERIVFDFATALPGYDVRYVSQVIADGSGSPITMPGHRYLLITFRPAQGHDDSGHATIAARQALNYPMLKGYVVAGDSEGVLTIALGLERTTGFTVNELPGRIYIDVAS